MNERKPFFKEKFKLIKNDFGMLSSSLYLCSQYKNEIIRGVGYCDSCGSELFKSIEVGFFGDLLE